VGCEEEVINVLGDVTVEVGSNRFYELMESVGRYCNGEVVAEWKAFEGVCLVSSGGVEDEILLEVLW